jgi:peptidoglycan/LPS O-acetylase OafA/YrhL
MTGVIAQPSRPTELPPASPTAPHGYRPALDGVRAIAVFGVIFYHLGYGWMRGGFLGVDVFFVLSGYLITSMLLSDLDRGGIRLASFWARRARRLLPAILVVCVAVGVAVHVWQPVTTWSIRQADLLWTIFYGMNWHLIASDQNYFTQYLGASPLRHAWSLAIEEQFYVVWPLALILIARLLRASKLGIGIAVGVAALASAITLAILYDPGAASRAYYGTDSRAHELLVGALLGLGLTWRPSLTQARQWMFYLAAIVGILVVATAFIAVPDSWAGYYRGGSLFFSIVVAGFLWSIESRPLGIVARALSLAPLRWLGQISYGLYLWHWPVIVFATSAVGAIGASRLLRIFATVVIATLSYFVVEQPIRRGRLIRLRLTNRWVLAVAPSAMVVVAGGSIFMTVVPPVTAVAIEPGEYICPGNMLVCIRHAGSSPLRPVVAVVGDSTGRSLDVGITDLAKKYDWTYVAAAQDGCSIIDRVALLGPANQAPPGNARCPRDNATIRQELLDVYRPNLIIEMENFLQIDALDAAGNRLVVGSAAHIADTDQGLEKVAEALTSRGARMVFVENQPVELPLSCSIVGTAAKPECRARASSDAITAQYDAVEAAVAARHPSTMRALSITNVVCPHDYCVPTIKGVLLRYDRYHFTKAGAHWLAPYLYQGLQRVGAVPITIT